MDNANADSDNSMTWEDFFGSTTDLTPTLIGIYDSLLEPKPSRPEVTRFEVTDKDGRNEPPLPNTTSAEAQLKKTDEANNISISPPKETSKLSSNIKLLGRGTVNMSSLYTIRTKVESDNQSDKPGAPRQSVDNVKCSVSSNDSSFLQKSSLYKTHLRSFKNDKVSDISAPVNTFDNLSPNVKRMISSATETSTSNAFKLQKKTHNPVRSSIRGHKSNIPLVGATSKISQSGVEILPSVEIYDQPCGVKASKVTEEDKKISSDSPSKTAPIRAEFRLEADAQATYDVPTNKQAIYDVPTSKNKTAFESLSLPFIDQSIELSISANDREFDTKLSSTDNSPDKPPQPKTSTPESSPIKFSNPIASNGTNSLHRKDFVSKNDSPKLLKANPYPETIGSTGNLKLCSVPEKEGHLQPPSVEVSRPLSMSSIASSSSTSSSGVQNKGGVNSAYLASIESLDDQSDADVASGVGSNNFVNSAGVLAAGISSDDRRSEAIPRFETTNELPVMSQLERVCGEIVQTENVYVEDLRQVVQGYLHVWREGSVFSEDELVELFNNIEDIYAFNKSLCQELNECQLEATSIARCFVDNTTGFTVYTSYCTGYPRTMERLAVLASRPHSARMFRERQLALEHPLPLASYLLKPVQRILKYHLLLQNVVKLCACRETEFALLKMTGIAHHIDDMKRKHEHAVRVQEIQSLLYGWSGPDLTTYGELCAEGTFRVFGAKAMRHVFLFDKMLLVTKNREDGILAYKSHIMCNNMMLVESIAGAALSFHVIPWDAPRAQLTLQATSHRHKREWTLLLKRVILENYNAVIPSHARQLVMELGQNKTDDDILAEKSHNLITQASMRKQLSAPEYLEKRKLERERRKSFENGNRARLKKINRKYTVPVMPSEEVAQDICDCAQVSAEKGTDYTCDHCYVDLCSDCETQLFNKDNNKEEKCNCKTDVNELSPEKCPECDRSLHYIDSGSAEHLERKQSCCKCSDFKSSQESVGKEFTSTLNKTRGYHSSDNIVSYTDNKKIKEDLGEANNSSYTNVRNIKKTCLKCAKIKENIAVTESTSNLHSRKSRRSEFDKRTDALRSKSKEDPQRSKLSKIGTWRRKSEPGLQQNIVAAISPKKSVDVDIERGNGKEKIEFECRICGSNKITRKVHRKDGSVVSDPELDNRRRVASSLPKQGDIKMYNSKNIPKKISKLKKNRAKGLRLGSDTTAKFYADLSTDVSTENILHISESTDSLNNVAENDQVKTEDRSVPVVISKDEDIDEETYKKLIEKTDSFKKNELEKVKYLNQQKVINEGSEVESDKQCDVQCRHTNEDVAESCEETEQPLEQIISQLLMQNREFQKLLKKQQLRNSAQRRHQRLLKSHSNPEQEITQRSIELNKIRPKYGRQTSENLDLHTVLTEVKPILSPPNEANDSEDDHIYETLRVEAKSDKTTDTEKPAQCPALPQKQTPESDYVYLSFNELSKSDDLEEGIYDVPVKRVGGKVDSLSKRPTDYYVTVEQQGPRPVCLETAVDNLYDNIVEVCRRQKESVTTAPSDYLPMRPENPNMPEIWLSRQKEHFNTTRDRKSGSLPRSFQIVTTNQEENNLSTFRNKPNNNSKTYLNRDGKVLSIDRPFTIASDKSDISFDDVENYMSDGDILKFNKNTINKRNEEDDIRNISQSTLELEQEIDRCYKNNFEEMNIDSKKDENILTVSQPNLNVSTASSCEVLVIDNNSDNTPKDVIHPEHKIYKPTSNMLSLKNVLSRFKSKNPNKTSNLEASEINANESNSPDKSDLKSPTSEKRSGLNPRSYSKNLLQRFRSIIGDEQTDGNSNKPESNKTQTHTEVDGVKRNEIKVVITSTDVSPITSTVYTINNDLLSRSVCDNTTLTESQNEKNNLEIHSHSCDNINNQKKEPIFRPTYEKSVSMVTNISTSAASTPSPSKSNSNSYQSLNKLPIYMQGSKHLGARIAQSDYVDPTSLRNDSKFQSNNINVLINKSSVRPDSLFSTASFVTSSSEGVYQIPQNVTNTKSSEQNGNQKSSDSSNLINSDESFYEKSFEKIEHVTDEDVFRDSAVYSDQEDEGEIKTDSTVKERNVSKQVTRMENVNRNSSFRSEILTVTSTKSENKISTQTRVTVSARMQQIEKIRKDKPTVSSIARPKLAPPIPVKPKLITNIPTTETKTFIYNKSNKEAEISSLADTNTIKRNTNLTSKQLFMRSESTPTETIKLKADCTKQYMKKDNVETQHKELILERSKNLSDTSDIVESSTSTLKTSQNSIQMKRLSFERASLDSASRKTKPVLTDTKIPTAEIPKMTSKTVLERRMEIESISKNVTTKPTGLAKKPSLIAKPKPIVKKLASFEHPTNTEENNKKDIVHSSTVDSNNIPTTETSINNEENKESWVKQVVNKFQ